VASKENEKSNKGYGKRTNEKTQNIKGGIRIKMCKKKQFNYCPSEIDNCMKNLIKFLKKKGGKELPISCCCGHKKYKTTVIMFDGKRTWELFSNIDIPRTKKHYRTDKEGYYFVPEVEGIK